MADNKTVARPYAQAVFEMANASGQLDEWAGALDTARELLEDGRVIEYLSNPAFTDARRLEFLTGLFADAGVDLFAGSNVRGRNFLRLALENDRLAALPDMAEHFEKLKAEVENVVDVTVTSAAELSDSQRQTIAAALRERLGRNVKVETEIDSNLIGGAVVRAGDVVIDGSLRARLQGLANALTK